MMIQPHENLSLIVAVSDNGMIGRENGLPWRLSADLRRFKQLTMGHAIIMGRTTFESIGRPLPGRDMIVLTGQPGYRVDGATVVHNWDAVWKRTRADSEPFIVGGATIYEQSLPWCRTMYLTRVHEFIEGDTRFNWEEDEWWLESREPHRGDERNEFDYTFEVYRRRDHFS